MKLFGWSTRHIVTNQKNEEEEEKQAISILSNIINLVNDLIHFQFTKIANIRLMLDRVREYKIDTSVKSMTSKSFFAFIEKIEIVCMYFPHNRKRVQKRDNSKFFSAPNLLAA